MLPSVTIRHAADMSWHGNSLWFIGAMGNFYSREISWTNIRIWAWISNYVFVEEMGVIIYSCPAFKGAVYIDSRWIYSMDKYHILK